MAFKGEISAAKLDNIKGGFGVGDIYRIIEAGRLGSVALPFGTFVEWKGTYWEVKADMQYAISDNGEGMDQAIGDLIDRETRGSNVTLTMPHDQNFYEVGTFYKYEDKIYSCTQIVGDGEGSDTVTLHPYKGIVDISNGLKQEIIAVYASPHTPPTTEQVSLSNTYHVGDFVTYPITRGDMVVPSIAEIVSDDGADPEDPSLSELYTVRTASGVVEALQSLAARVYTLENT